MTPLYVNGMQIQLNELAMIEFRLNSRSFNGPVALLAMQYEVLKQMHTAIGNAIEQYDKNVHELQRTKANMN